MQLSNITSKFQNYTYNEDKTISQILADLKNSDLLDTNDLKIQEYLLPEILTLLQKAILNRFSTDLLFQKNYWSWGFVTLYYSNFYLSQALNRLKGDFFVYIPSFGRKGRKNVKLDYEDNQYKLLDIENIYRDSHKGELKKLKENYIVLIGTKFSSSILDINESQIRNEINYTFNYYKEFDNNFRNDINIIRCQTEYKNNTSTIEEFKLLKINDNRFELIFHLFDNIKNENKIFENCLNELNLNFEDSLIYKYDNSYMKHIESIFKKNTFHIPSKLIHTQFKGYL